MEVLLQEHFEAILFNVLRTRGFGDEYVDRYKMVTKFFQQRRPLIVLICGVPCTGARNHVSRQSACIKCGTSTPLISD